MVQGKKEDLVAYLITSDCLQCGYCVERCPQGAIVAYEKVYQDGLVLQPVAIDQSRCTQCGVCVSEEYWCPAQAILSTD